MPKISNILLAIDDDHDDQALVAEILSLTRDNPASVTILSVTDASYGHGNKHFDLIDWQKADAEQRSKQLQRLSTALSEHGIKVAIEQTVGKSHLEIIKRTLNNKFDLVMKPARKEAGLKQYLLGSSDVQLMSLCADPVWIFQPTPNRVLKNIGVAVDLNPDDPERTALVAELLGWGKYIATLVGAELHILHAWSLYRESAMRSGSVTPHLIDELVFKTEIKHRGWLNAAMQQIKPVEIKVHKHLRKGDSEHVLSQMTETLNIDLLIMGTVGRTGIPGFFIGNTADAILRKVTCSVLTIKPEKFKTPVKPSK